MSEVKVKCFPRLRISGKASQAKQIDAMEQNMPMKACMPSGSQDDLEDAAAFRKAELQADDDEVVSAEHEQPEHKPKRELEQPRAEAECPWAVSAALTLVTLCVVHCWIVTILGILASAPILTVVALASFAIFAFLLLEEVEDIRQAGLEASRARPGGRRASEWPRSEWLMAEAT